MITIKETAGDTLGGAIDGANRVFTTSYDFIDGKVNVFHNGLLLVGSLDNGYTLSAPRTVTLKEAPVVGDTLEIEYQNDARTGGGALGGVPQPPLLEELKPGMLDGRIDMRPIISGTSDVEEEGE